MKTIAITGSSSGLGAAIAKKFKFVYNISRTNNLDVTNYNSIKEYFKYLNPFPETLINNAAIVIPGSILELNQCDWLKQINTNLNGVFNCSQIYAKECIRRNLKGKIINVASTAAKGARPGYSAYAATKSAIVSFSQSIREELKKYGIDVYCISPAAFNSNLRKTLYPDDDFVNMLQPEKVAEYVYKIINDEMKLLLKNNIKISL
jgi:3-oxoacyl-[acyl-carrier protein] reductase